MKQSIKQKIIQKIAGVFFIGASIIPIYLDSEATAGLILIPLGTYLLFTKHQVID